MSGWAFGYEFYAIRGWVLSCGVWGVGVRKACGHVVWDTGGTTV